MNSTISVIKIRRRIQTKCVSLVISNATALFNTGLHGTVIWSDGQEVMELGEKGSSFDKYEVFIRNWTRFKYTVSTMSNIVETEVPRRNSLVVDERTDEVY